MRIHRQTANAHELISQFDEWIDRHWNRLYACAEKNADAATDVGLLFTDTLRIVARVYAERPMGEELLVRYTMRCLRNAARQAHLRNQRRSAAETQFGQASCPQEVSHAANSLAAAMLDELQRLPVRYGSIIKMHLWEDLGFPDIAQRLGTCGRTARRYYKKAIGMLRKRKETRDHE